MELTRVFLLSALFLLGLMLWQAWENDYAKSPNALPPITTSNGTSFQPTTNLSTATPATPPSASVPVNSSAAIAPAPTVSPANNTGQLLQVHTDVLNLTINTLGGNIVQADLLHYPQQLNSPQPYELLSTAPTNFYVAQSGLIGNVGPDTAQGQAVYQSAQTHYQLLPGQNQLTVDLTWKDPAGLTVIKRFNFTRNSYLINVSYIVANNSQQAWTGQFYAQLQRKKPASQHGLFGINAYTGGAISSPDKPYEKISFSKMDDQDLNQVITGGWAAMLEHYFLSAWIPVSSQAFTYYTHVSNNDLYTLGVLSMPVTIAPGKQTTFAAKMYTGPGIMDNLKAAAPNLDLTIDYGFLWFISIAIFWLMKHIYQIVGNWGWSIVLVTVLIKLAFYHLSAKSYRSMAAMRNLQPRLQALRERYGEDRQKLTQATMELYKTEKINPLGGCLPVIVQIPVFIALYWVLIESVELRQAPFILWIHDLSTKDPYYILPIIMGLTMFIQQRLNPPPPDPMQAKMMMFMPVFFTFLFLNFPAGLVLYWIVNNSLSILQQWYIMRRLSSGTGLAPKQKRV